MKPKDPFHELAGLLELVVYVRMNGFQDLNPLVGEINPNIEARDSKQLQVFKIRMF
jgi:hypothetical protein